VNRERRDGLAASASASASAPLVLASTSPYRRALLERLGVPFRTEAPTCDERAVQREVEDDLARRGVRREERPDAIARHLASAKARSVAGEHAGAFVLGSDQLVDVDGEVLGKPGSRERAIAQLGRLAGRTHRLVTAIALYTPKGVIREHTTVHTMRVRSLAAADVAAYVDRDRPFDCAGSYRIEGAGIALFEAIDGDDFTAIEGLPLMRVTTLLLESGFPVFAEHTGPPPGP
jgi:septum formation protein